MRAASSWIVVGVGAALVSIVIAALVGPSGLARSLVLSFGVTFCAAPVIWYYGKILYDRSIPLFEVDDPDEQGGRAIHAVGFNWPTAIGSVVIGAFVLALATRSTGLELVPEILGLFGVAAGLFAVSSLIERRLVRHLVVVAVAARERALSDPSTTSSSSPSIRQAHSPDASRHDGDTITFTDAGSRRCFEGSLVV